MNKIGVRIAFATTLALIGAGAVSAGPIEDLQPGHWAIVSQNTIDDVDPCPSGGCSYSAIEGVAAVIDDWNGGAFATGYGTLGGLVAWGGGHNGYFGNEVYVFALDTLRWERVSEPVINPSCNYSTGELQDGSPCSAHTYDYVDYHPTTNSFVLLGGASLHTQGGGGTGRVHLFDFDTLQWRAGATRSGNISLTGASSDYDPKRDVFWLLPAYGQRFARYDPNANAGQGAWTQYNSVTIDIDAVSAIHRERDLFVTLDVRGAQRVLVHDLTNPSAAPVTVNTTGQSAPQSAWPPPGFEYDPVTQTLITWTGGASVYSLTPPAGDWRTGTWTWTRIDPAPGNTVVPSAPNRNGTYSRFRYAPAANAFVVVNDTNGPVYMYKLTEGAGSVMSVSLSASAETVNGGEYVNLEWSTMPPAATCTAEDAWSGTKASAGTEIVGPIEADSTFTLRCGDGSGPTVARSVNVAVTDPVEEPVPPPAEEPPPPVEEPPPPAEEPAPPEEGGSAGAISGVSSGGGGAMALTPLLLLLVATRLLRAAVRRERTHVPVATAAVVLIVALGVPNLVLADATSDFLSRATAPGVVYYEGFDSSAAVLDKRLLDGQQQYISFDTTTLASGSGSMRFEIPSNSWANSSGNWRSNFSENLSVKFGAGEDFYVQWRQRFSRGHLENIYQTTDGSGGGWKQIILGEGDYPGQLEEGSCTALEVVVQNLSQRHFPQMYTNCGDYWPMATNFASQYNSFDFKLQNAVNDTAGRNDAERYVLYSQEGFRVNQVRPDFPGMAYYPDEWMTFQVHISPGALGCATDSLMGSTRCGFTNSRVELWVARENQPSMKVIDVSGLVLRRSDGSSDTDEKYGKVWLTPYHTNKSASQSHAVGYTWYDELIVSTERIPDPGVTGPSLTLDADPLTVTENEFTTLSWSSDADSCEASGDWSGAKATLGSEMVGPLSADSQLSLSCTGGPSGGTTTRSVTITVTQTTPPEEPAPPPEEPAPPPEEPAPPPEETPPPVDDSGDASAGASSSDSGGGGAMSSNLVLLLLVVALWSVARRRAPNSVV